MERRDNMPEWVFWGLWGINSRSVALGFFWFCILAAILLVPVSYIYWNIIVGIGCIGSGLAAAGWYWFSIKWVDDNGGWS